MDGWMDGWMEGWNEEGPNQSFNAEAVFEKAK